MQFVDTSYTVDEDGLPATQITLQRSGDTTRASVVQIVFDDGTATGGNGATPKPLTTRRKSNPISCIL